MSAGTQQFLHFYSDKLENKKSGTGIALYVHETFNAIKNIVASTTQPHLECIFLKVTKGVKERSHMTSAAEGEGFFKMLTVADKGGGGLSVADVSKNT